MRTPAGVAFVFTSIVLLEDGRIGDLSVLAVTDTRGWRGRVIFQPAGGLAEIVDCPEVDPTITLAQTRAEVLAVVRFPLADPLPDEDDRVA
jgi:hypothetical protein